MIDTGSDTSSIGLGDWRRLRVSQQSLGPTTIVAGLAGTAEVSAEVAEITLRHDTRQIDTFRVEIDIVPGGSPIVPSILGRDILARYRLTYSPSEQIVHLERPE